MRLLGAISVDFGWCCYLLWKILLAKHIFGGIILFTLFLFIAIFIIQILLFLKYCLVLCDLSMCSEAALVILHRTSDLKKVRNLFIFTTFPFESLIIFMLKQHNSFFPHGCLVSLSVTTSRKLDTSYCFHFVIWRVWVINWPIAITEGNGWTLEKW